MVEIIPNNRRNNVADMLMGGIQGASNAFQGYQQGQDNQRALAKDKKLVDTLKGQFGIDTTGWDPEMRKALVSESLKGQNKAAQMGQKQEFLSGLFGNKGQQPQRQEQGRQLQGMFEEEVQPEQNFDPINFSDEDIFQAASMDPAIAREMRAAKNTRIEEEARKEKAAQHKFEADRAYHSSFSKDIEKKSEAIRDSIPKKESALIFARDAIESGNMGYFSPDKLADALGIDLFRTAKGAQLVTAGKENLLGNLGRVSSKGQNLWFEQRLNSMFPKIGQSEEANLTVQEMLEGEIELEKSYLDALDRISAEDQEKYGFVKKDINKRAHDAIKAQDKEIFKRTTYRMKEIEEKENGLSFLKKQVGKNVPSGTPLTLGMAQLYKKEFGDNALAVAKKNGYYIPTKEEFLVFQQTPREKKVMEENE